MSIVTIDPETIEVDDGYPFIFSTGSWSQGIMIGFFNDTVSYSHIAGDMKFVRFVGTSITVQGGLQQYSTPGQNPPLTSYSIDNGPSTTYYAPTPLVYTAVTYYKSPQLSMGEHVLTINNTVNNDIVHLDAFIIQAEGATPKILQSDGSPVPKPARPSAGPTITDLTLPLNSSASAGHVPTPHTGTRSTSLSSQRGSNSTEISTTVPLYSSSTSLLSSGSTQPTDTAILTIATSTPTVPAIPVLTHHSITVVIIASICGAVFVIALIAILLKRRNKRRQNICAIPRHWDFDQTSSSPVVEQFVVPQKGPAALTSTVQAPLLSTLPPPSYEP